MLHLTVLLSRAPQVEAAFDKLMADQQDPHSTHYHQWLTPQQSGILFGATQDDIGALSKWLQDQGFTIDNVAPSRIFIEVSAPVSIVSVALATNFYYFKLPHAMGSGGSYLSATSEPAIPTTFIPLVEAISGLSHIPVHAMSQRRH
jgi:subtilase family serine protease